MRILVTGAAGLIGYEVCSILQSLGNEVVGIYRVKPKLTDVLLKVECIVLDLSEDGAWKTLKSLSCDVVVHCAASIPTSFVDDDINEVANCNRLIDDNIIRFCSEYNLRLIFISSSSIYEQYGQLINEDSSVLASNRYSFEKVRTELEVEKLLNSPVILRINSPYGNRQRHKTVINMFINKALSGNDIYYYGTGSRSQDFTHCKDIANAVCQVVERASVTGIYNISSGCPISMRKLAELIISLVPGTTSRLLAAGKDDPQEDYRAMFDITKATQALDWQPRVPLEVGIEEWISSLDKT